MSIINKQGIKAVLHILAQKLQQENENKIIRFNSFYLTLKFDVCKSLAQMGDYYQTFSGFCWQFSNFVLGAEGFFDRLGQGLGLEFGMLEIFVFLQELVRNQEVGEKFRGFV
ncbi:hypothetical protein PPERSA_11018 [Pseudocohnilembus persalinus]|uniref:Uncharacterized protein n=1 Tax=Pseudocohnilembus persalinus TaxID=266149 RepID=A0A0V0QZH1_PSEPJ|nr:hypothetical protein PPERSA_11018 [Pseudocohnilembus persalinus]|eukprot:KRX07469.1 hypothetical protein PPERSA_11018 [Pseudocohnilembus persalinus]